MNDIHYLTTVTQTSRYVGLKCPVRKTPFKLGQTIIVCQESDVAFSLEGWNYLKTTTCPYCEQNVFLPSKKDEKPFVVEDEPPQFGIVKFRILGFQINPRHKVNGGWINPRREKGMNIPDEFWVEHDCLEGFAVSHDFLLLK